MGILLNNTKLNRIKKLVKVCAIAMLLLIIMPSLVYAGACPNTSTGNHDFSGMPIFEVIEGDEEYISGKDLSKINCKWCSATIVFEDPGHRFAYGRASEDEQKKLHDKISEYNDKQADNTTDAGTGGTMDMDNPVDTEDEPVYVSSSDPSDKLFNGFLGVLLLIPKYLFILFGLVIEAIGKFIFSLTQGEGVSFSPDTILFNGLDLLNIDFFDINSANGSALTYIRQNIQTWYYNFRNLAIGALLVTLIYIGIRMALSTLSEDKAKYKKLLRYWIESFVLLWMLQFIMILVIEVNTQIVGLIEIGKTYDNADFLSSAVENNNLLGFAQAICYVMNLGATIAFFLMYLKRLAVVGFLVVIAPLITITYSIDKVKDGQSQALNKWLQQFMYNVLIQVFHCILYVIFVSAVFEATMQSGEDHLGFLKSFIEGEMSQQLVTSVMSIAMLAFIWQAEKIVKGIFGFDKAKSTLMDSIVAGKMIQSGMKATKKTIKSTKKTAKGMLKLGDAATGHKVSNWYNNTPNLKRRLGKVGYGYNKTKDVVNKLGRKCYKKISKWSNCARYDWRCSYSINNYEWNGAGD